MFTKRVVIISNVVIHLNFFTPPNIGQIIQLWGNDVKIIEIVKDFHFDSFHEAVKPIFFILEDDGIISW